MADNEVSKSWYAKYRPQKIQDYLGDSVKNLVQKRFTKIEPDYELDGIGVKKSYYQKKREIPTIYSLIDIFPLLQQLEYLK